MLDFLACDAALYPSKVNNPYKRLGRHLGLQEVEAVRISRQSAHEAGKVVSLYPSANILDSNFCYKLSRPQHVQVNDTLSRLVHINILSVVFTKRRQNNFFIFVDSGFSQSQQNSLFYFYRDDTFRSLVHH
jgi:hypothetical protein